jgi:hypothetical protein
MVNIRRSTDTVEIREWAGTYIPLLIECWEDLPRIAQDIECWEDGEALTYIVEWPLREMEREKLENYSEKGLLSAEQTAQLAYLRKLVIEHKPLLDRLLDPRAAS